MTDIHLARDGADLGVHDLAAINQMLAAGQLTGTELAWAKGMGGWISLSQVRGVIMPGRPQPMGFAPRPGFPPVPPAPANSAAATTSMISGILAVLGIFMAGLGIIPGIVAVICGHKARDSIQKSGGQLGGSGMALAGLITGYIGIVLCAAILGFIVWSVSAFSKKIAEEKNITAEKVVETRSMFTTTLQKKEREDEETQPPPDSSPLRLMKYDSPLGPMDAYVSKESDGPRSSPAIVWLTGGFSNSIDEGSFTPGDPGNDQSATAFQQPRLIGMYPSLRGGNQNPGFKEGHFGEVEDVLAAIKWLKARPGVDPRRVYLGGHSTGGTLALLVAEASTDLRAVFVFGAVARVSDYGQDALPYSVRNASEGRMRSPITWLPAIQCPTFVIEGTDGNIEGLHEMEAASKNPKVKFFEIPGRDHFGVLQPVSKMLAQMILDDTGSEPNLPVTRESISAALRK